VKEIAEYCYSQGMGCHIDCNYSSFLLNFDGIHFDQEYDAHLETQGVTSIGVSWNKYGLGFSGAAVLLYKTRLLRKMQYYAYSNWNGGMYVTSNLAGSRYSSAIAATWTKMLATGKNNYITKANKIITATSQFRIKLNQLKEHIEIITPNSASILAFRLKEGDSYNLADFLRSKDYNVVNTINPPAISITVTEGKLKNHRR